MPPRACDIGLNVNIKWPNDLVVANDKLAGVLIETTRVENKTVAVIGIGINFVLPKEVENATSVQALFQTASKQGVSVEALLNAVLAQLDALLNEYAQNGFASCVVEYDAANRDTGRAGLAASRRTRCPRRRSQRRGYAKARCVC